MGSVDAFSAGVPWEVPALVVETSRFVYQFGLEAEGIFRISPPVSVVQEVKTTMAEKDSARPGGRFARRFSNRKEIKRGEGGKNEENKYDSISSITNDPHVAAHILKDFLRKLDDPLFPVGINAQLIVAVKEADFSKKIQLYKEVLSKSLSVSCRRVLIAISFLCKNVVKHTAANKMSYQALGVVFGPCLIRLDPMQMIEMWDSRIAEELFGNFGAIVEDIPESEFQVVAQIVDVPEVKFSKDPPMTAKVTMLNKADIGEDGGKVDLQINVTFIGDETNYKFELFCACAAKQAPSDPVRAKMRKAYLRPLESVAMLDTGTKVGVKLTYAFDWTPPSPTPPTPSPSPPPRNPGIPFSSSNGPPPVPPPKAPRNPSFTASNPPPVPTAPLPTPLASLSNPPQVRALPTPPTSLPPPPGAGGPLVGSSSVPVTKQEHKQVAQDYKEILKNSNVIVLPFSICNGKSLDAVVDKWIPALMKLQVTAPVVLVGCEKEKRAEGMEGLVSEDQAKEVRAMFSNVEKYVEISTITYKGFRTLADAGLDAFLLDYHNKQQKRRVSEIKTTPSAPALSANLPSLPTPPPPSSSSGGSGSKIGRKEDEKCVVM